MARPVNAKPPKTVKYVVEGAGSFPLDMLRYDRAWFATEADAGTAQHDRKIRTVTLRGLDYPTGARWESFSWRVQGILLTE
jgi:hypothetical protein